MLNHDWQTVRNVKMLEGVSVYESKAQKDELIIEGTDVQNVSQSGTFLQSEELGSNQRFPSRVNPGHLPSAQQGYPKVP